MSREAVDELPANGDWHRTKPIRRRLCDTSRYPEHRSLPSIAASQLLQESEVRGSVEDGVLPVMETSLPQFNGPKNLHALALSGHGNFRRTTDPAPGGVQGRILAKAGFVGEDQRPVLPLRFFLRLG